MRPPPTNGKEPRCSKQRSPKPRSEYYEEDRHEVAGWKAKVSFTGVRMSSYSSSEMMPWK